MTEATLQPKGKPLIEADLGENGGHVAFASISEATSWIESQISAWRMWEDFSDNMHLNSLRTSALKHQLALPLKITERLANAETLEGDELSAEITEITGLFEQYADYRSVYAWGTVGKTILSIRGSQAGLNQLAAVGVLFGSIGAPAPEVLGYPGLKDHELTAVLSGYAIGKDLVFVKRSEIIRQEERMEKYVERFRKIVADATTNNDETKEESKRVLETMTQEARDQETSWKAFFKSTEEEWTRLRDTFDVQLRLEAPASYWAKEAKRTFEFAIGALLLFTLLAGVVIGVLVEYGPSLLERLADIGNNGSYANLVIISIPALTALWGLRHIARLFVTNLEQSRDAKMRETMATTFLALTKEGAFEVEANERLLVLEALFRPPGSNQGDDGHFGGVLEVLTRRNSQD